MKGATLYTGTMTDSINSLLDEVSEVMNQYLRAVGYPAFPELALPENSGQAEVKIMLAPCWIVKRVRLELQV